MRSEMLCGVMRAFTHVSGGGTRAGDLQGRRGVPVA